MRDVSRMQAAAGERRLLTFTIEADVGFRSPADVEAFTTALADAVADASPTASTTPTAGATASSPAATPHPPPRRQP